MVYIGREERKKKIERREERKEEIKNIYVYSAYKMSARVNIVCAGACTVAPAQFKLLNADWHADR